MPTEKEIAEKILAHREWMKGWGGEYESDQEKKLPQPPLTKGASGEILPLTKDFDGVMVENDYLKIISTRRSRRMYQDTPMTLAQLAFLLWTTQGVVDMRGGSYATLRPVPSAGARHPFETYMIVRNVEGLAPGLYHYLAMEHGLEFMGGVDDMDTVITDSLIGQSWGAKASVVFFYSAVPYRGEWRYSYNAHKVALLDAGHVMQNLCISSEAIGCGACAIASYDQAMTDRLFKLDGQEEFVIYAATVGRKAQ